MVDTFTPGAEVIVNTTTANDQYSSYKGENIAATADGGYVIVWFSDDDNNSSTDVGKIYLQRFDANGTKVGTEQLVSTQAGSNMFPGVTALAGGGFAVTWTLINGADGLGNDVFVQRYDAAGVKLGAQITVAAADPSGTHHDASGIVGLPGGGFIVSWDQGTGDVANPYDVYFQRYDASGNTVGAATRVNTATANYQDSTHISLLNGGGFVVTWNSLAQDGSGYGVYFQRFDANGVAQGTETQVNTTTAGHQFYNNVTTLQGGDFVVAWSIVRADNTLDVLMQRYTSAGVAVGGETPVNTTTILGQRQPDVLALNDGGYIVAWHSNGQDGSQWGSYFQRYAANGAKVGGETRINVTTAGDQIEPVMALLKDGNIAITWQSWGQDGSGNGMVNRVYYLDQTITDAAGVNGNLTGGRGSDTINGLDGNDMLFGGEGPGKDSLIGGAGNDTITIWGGDGADGGDGNDIFYATHLTGENITGLTGGAGYDIMDTTLIDGGPGWGFVNFTSIEEYRGGNFTDFVDASLVTVSALLFSGGGGNDTLRGGSQNDTLTGGLGNDSLEGNGGNDTITGADGNDALIGGAGADSLRGGIGDDLYGIDNVGDVITEAAGEGIDNVASLISYTLGANLEKLVLGGAGSINGIGNGLNNQITGNTGHNLIDGLAGADTMVGGAGNDTYGVDNAGDVITELAGGGVDLVNSSITLTAAAEIDNITLTGSAHINATGNGLANLLTGNGGNNILDGLAGADTMRGGLGNDTYYVDNIADNVVENHLEGTDTIISSVTYTLNGRAAENLTLTGSAALNATGNTLNNALNGNGGNNVLDGGVGADTMTGGLGDDTYYVDNAGDSVRENHLEGSDTVISSVAYTLNGRAAENLTLTGTASLNISGNSLANVLTGNSGNNILDGGLGNDSMIGGLGDDLYVVDVLSDIVVENAGQGTDTIQTALTYTLGANIENLYLTGSAAVNATGNALNNRLTGNAGTNVLSGGLGNDTYYVQSTSDSIVEAAGEGTDQVVISTLDWTLGANIENLTMIGIGHLNATGNALNNVMIGNAGINTLAGGLGDDIYYIQTVGDRILENHGEGFDTVVSTITYSLFGRAIEILILSGTADLNATGNSLDNQLTGNTGNNVLEGGAGRDKFKGDLGADTFLFLTGSGVDFIRDFSAAQNDSININAYTGGIANAGMVAQAGANVVITLGGGNVINVENALRADVLAHMVW